MSPDPPDELRALLDLARNFLGRHEEVRQGVAAVGRALAALAEWSAPGVSAPAPATPVVAPPPVPEPSPPPAEAPISTPAATSDHIPLSQLPPLRIGLISPPLAAHPTTDDNRELDLLPLTLIADRCRIKGEACRLIRDRLADPFGTRNSAAETDVLHRAAALPDCNLWMLNRDPVVAVTQTWSDLAGAFTTAADAAHLLRDWEQAPAALAERHAARVLGLAAEAQSVLLYAVADVRDVKVDFDQVQLFAHVRSTARDRQVFIPKYLKREDRAAPESWPEVARRVAEAATQFRTVGERDKSRLKAMKNLRYKLTRLREQPEEMAEQWPRVLELVEELVAGGLPPSNTDLRDLLLPVLEDIPDDPPPSANVQLVLREIDRYLDTRPDADPPARVVQPSAEVLEVAELLHGREMVLIGGQARPLHRAALMRSFGLADVRWLCTPDHTSFTVFEPDVARPEVALVLLAIRWSNHDYDGVRAYCEAYGKPLIRLPGGYNANQVAHHILTQAGDRLRHTKAAAG